MVAPSLDENVSTPTGPVSRSASLNNCYYMFITPMILGKGAKIKKKVKSGPWTTYGVEGVGGLSIFFFNKNIKYKFVCLVQNHHRKLDLWIKVLYENLKIFLYYRTTSNCSSHYNSFQFQA